MTSSGKRQPRERLERDVQGPVIKALQAQGCVAIRVNAGRIPVKDEETGKTYWIRLARKGTSDVIAGVPMTLHLANGETATLLVFAAVECKRPGENPTDEQRDFLNRVRADGGLSVVARGLDDVQRLLGAVERASAATKP